MNTGKEFEKYVQSIYQQLIQISGEDISVQRNVRKVGRTGVEHEFDVYYEFKHLNIVYSVAIECKDWKDRVPKSKVLEFDAKINDFNNMSGVMISNCGYQEGAKLYAKNRGIYLLENKDLPDPYELMLKIFQNALLPDEKAKGDPFWTIMEMQDGHLTGTYYAINESGLMILLFYSKEVVKYVLDKIPDNNNWCIRGVTKQQLNALINMLEISKDVKIGIINSPFILENMGELPIVITPLEKLKNYL